MPSDVEILQSIIEHHLEGLRKFSDAVLVLGV